LAIHSFASTSLSKAVIFSTWPSDHLAATCQTSSTVCVICRAGILDGVSVAAGSSPIFRSTLPAYTACHVSGNRDLPRVLEFSNAEELSSVPALSRTAPLFCAPAYRRMAAISSGARHPTGRPSRQRCRRQWEWPRTSRGTSARGRSLAIRSLSPMGRAGKCFECR
jgi:hypothetical protein